MADLTGAVPDLVVADEGLQPGLDPAQPVAAAATFSFTLGPRLNAGGIGPVSTVVGNFTGGPYPDLLVTNSGSNDVTLLPRRRPGVLQRPEPPDLSRSAATRWPALRRQLRRHSTDLVTVNAGSNDLTLISGFEGPIPATTTIASGGIDPDDGLRLQLRRRLRGPGRRQHRRRGLGAVRRRARGSDADVRRDRAGPAQPDGAGVLGLAGGQVQFYAATEGREAAALVALSLGGEIAPVTTLGPSPTVAVAQLVPLQESSLALAGTLLIVTLESPAGEVNPGAADSSCERPSDPARSVASVVSVGFGQSVFAQGRGDQTGGGDEGPTKPPKNRRTARTSTRRPSLAARILGTDEAVFERFDREHPGLTVPRPDEAPQTSPTGEHGEIQAPARGDRRLELETIDRAIESLDDHDPAALEQSRNRRVGETHQEYNDMKIGLVSFTHPTSRNEPGQEERFDIRPRWLSRRP